jgi:DNA-binding CsgD family transcriptional regulator
MPSGPKLSPQEQRVLELIGKGYSTERIAQRLGVTRGMAAQHAHAAIAFVKRRGRLEQGEESRLTPRQEDVAKLLREGLSDAEIAVRLGIGRRTAETHVGHVLRKRNARSRTELQLPDMPPVGDPE